MSPCGTLSLYKLDEGRYASHMLSPSPKSKIQDARSKTFKTQRLLPKARELKIQGRRSSTQADWSLDPWPSTPCILDLGPLESWTLGPWNLSTSSIWILDLGWDACSCVRIRWWGGGGAGVVWYPPKPTVKVSTWWALGGRRESSLPIHVVNSDSNVDQAPDPRFKIQDARQSFPGILKPLLYRSLFIFSQLCSYSEFRARSKIQHARQSFPDILNLKPWTRGFIQYVNKTELKNKG